MNEDRHMTAAVLREQRQTVALLLVERDALYKRVDLLRAELAEAQAELERLRGPA